MAADEPTIAGRRMGYYLRFNGFFLEAWKIESDIAVRLGVSNPEQGPGTYFKAGSGETIWETIQRQTPWFGSKGENPFHKAGLQPGKYYRRIARPTDAHPHEAPGLNPGARAERTIIAIARGQLTALTRQLDRICQTVQPAVQTFDAYGHEIRNLLILACTEVEAHWRGVLEANEVKKDRYTTQDYFALQGAMRLDEYAVTFPNYPWLKALRPYEGWRSTTKPTQDLKWYNAYNAVKHNREAEFARATLRYAFEALSACVIMMAAQYGLADGLGQRSELLSFFDFTMLPTWSPSEIYIYPYEEPTAEWSPVPFRF